MMMKRTMMTVRLYVFVAVEMIVGEGWLIYPSMCVTQSGSRRGQK
jgi:hypothetical protein